MATPSGAIAATGASWSGHFTCQKRPHHVSPTHHRGDVDDGGSLVYRPGMDRRRFLLTSLAGAFAGPLAVEAQQAGRIPRLCFLTFDPGTTQAGRFSPFFQRLRELGYVDGKTIAIDYLSADGRSERFPTLSAEC